MYPCKFDYPLSGNDWLQFYALHNVFHPGLDLNKGSGDSDCGADVVSPKDGTIEFVNQNIPAGRGLGIFVVIKHHDGFYSQHCHLKDAVVVAGQVVKEGDLIGHVGKTGTEVCHLHFEVFGEPMATLKRSWKYPWAFYPVGKSKAWIEKYYINPHTWLKPAEIPAWAKSAAEKAKAKGIIVDWSDPYRIFGNEFLEWSLEKAGLLDPSKHEGKVNQSRYAVALEKAGII